MASAEVGMIETSLLDFDPENPRFYRLNNQHDVTVVVEEMLDDESVQDLMLSIGQKGYFPGEPLLVVGKPDGRFIVVEGNRRLAAVKLLNGQLVPPAKRANSVKDIRAEAEVQPPKELPCLTYSQRRDVLRYLGYRHITGIREWDSLSKAKYLAELRQEFYSKQEFSVQMRSLAKDIGSRTDYVAQLLTALKLYEKAESNNFFGLPVSAKDVEFSYLTTALNYKNIYEWLGLTGRIDTEMPGLNPDNLKLAFAWMFAKDQQGRTILGESRNLDKLAAVVASDSAIHVLIDTKRLADAYLYTDGPESALQQAFDQANERVSVVWNMLPKTESLTKLHLSQSEKLAEDARAIRNFVREKLED